jgi:hypothetical protein
MIVAACRRRIGKAEGKVVDRRNVLEGVAPATPKSHGGRGLPPSKLTVVMENPD